MRKYLVTILMLLLAVILSPSTVLAAYNTVTFDTDTTLNLWGIPLNLTVEEGSEVAGLTVYSTYISLDLELGSNIGIKSSDKKELTNTLANTICGDSKSITYIDSGGTQTITVTPGDTCSPVVGPAWGEKETTTPVAEAGETAEVTVTASEGGSITYINPDGGSAEVLVPANAVSIDTTFSIEHISVVNIPSGPSGYSTISGQAYEFSATADGVSVSTLDTASTITFSYTDAQASGLDESTLQVHYYNSGTNQWVALKTILDVEDNTATVDVIHLTKFALMGKTEEKPISKMTVKELEAKIAEILSLITSLKAELAKLKGEVAYEGIPSGFSFQNNLWLGMSHSDIKYLQVLLNTNSDTKLVNTGAGSSGQETMFFGSLTKAAVIRFQEKYSSEVLAPWGFSKGTGFMGRTTREKLNSLLSK